MAPTRLASLLLLLVFCWSKAADAQTSVLTGAWERVSLRDSAGTIVQPPSPAAFAIYSASGHFAQIAIPTGRPTVAKPVTEMTREELLARFQRATAVRGTYTISGNRLMRRGIAHLNPAAEGAEVVQVFRIVGDTLVLSSPNPASRGEARFVRVR
jgi:hypothetical protein